MARAFVGFVLWIVLVRYVVLECANMTAAYSLPAKARAGGAW